MPNEKYTEKENISKIIESMNERLDNITLTVEDESATTDSDRKKNQRYCFWHDSQNSSH